MPLIDEYENRTQAYTDQDFLNTQASPSQLFESCNRTIFTRVSYMDPQDPPKVGTVAGLVKEVCWGSLSHKYIYEDMEARYIQWEGEYGVSRHVIFHYVSNTIIALLVYRRNGHNLSADVITKLMGRFDLRKPLLRAGCEILAEEILRRSEPLMMRA